MSQEIDFAALGQQAHTMLASDAAAAATPSPAPVAPASPSPAPTAAAVGSVTPPITPAPAPTDPALQGGQSAEATYQVDLGNGKVETLTLTQLRELHANGLRQQDYTRKTQEVARQRQEVETVYQQLRQAEQELQWARQVRTNPQLLMQEAQRLIQLQPAPVDPNKPLTVGDLGQTIQQLQAQLQQTAQQAQTQAQQYVEDRLQVANYAESINKTLNDVYTAHPVLKVHPEYEDVMRFRVAQLQPQSLEEANAAFKSVAREMATAIDAHYASRQQQAIQQRQQLAATGTEAPGGAPAPQPTPDFRKGSDLDWNKLAQAALAIK
jgi:hypothetical protein